MRTIGVRSSAVTTDVIGPEASFGERYPVTQQSLRAMVNVVLHAWNMNLIIGRMYAAVPRREDLKRH